MNEQLKELLYQMLETELGGVQVYTTALKCVVNDDLEQEWTKYLAQTERHVEVMRQLLGTLGLDAEQETSGGNANGAGGWWRGRSSGARRV
jgi:bacterioferritin (cytochrome b1)